MRKLSWISAPLLAGLLALTVACGGDDDDDAQSTNDGGSTSGGGAAVSQELNLAEAATQLMELRSFRFNLAFSLDFDLGDLETPEGEDDEFGAAFAEAFLMLFSDISMEGAYVAPDSVEMQMSIAGEDVSYVQIGNEAWMDDGSGWTETEPDAAELSPFGDPMSFTTELLPDAVLENAEISEEEIDGRDAIHYHFDKDSLEAAVAALGEDTADFADIEEMELDVWLIEGSIPVKIVISVSGTDPEGGKIAIDAEFSITDINEDIEIERPIP
jgi:hypothetical protein